MVADTINEVPNIDLKNQDTDIDKIEKVNGILNIDDHKGKAGNLWSAQIVSNRSGDGAWDAI
uniref:Adhesin n=1 Tax=Romanomermis culicivorax TaxID=13658 RepID=A0A915JT38_ROMCU